MKRTTTVGAIGLVRQRPCSAIAVAATSLGHSPAAEPAGRRSRHRPPVATTAPTATSRPDRRPRARRRSRPPTPLPTPLLVPAPLTGLLVTPGGRRPPPDRGDDRRPRPGPAAVRAVVGVGRLAGPRRGRHPALHGDLPGHPAQGDRPGPQLALLLHRLGGGMARDLRPRRRLAAGARRRSRPRATASTSTTATSSATAGRSIRITTTAPPHNLYTTGAKLRSDRASTSGAKDGTYKAVWQFAPDAPLESRPYGGTITVGYPYNTISYTYDRTTNTYLRSVTGEKRRPTRSTGRGSHPRTSIVMRMPSGR